MADVTLTSSYDGKGNVVLYGASATSDGEGAVTMSLDTGDRPNAIAMASINLSFVAEVESYFRYYMLRASTLAAPDKPTTYPPSASWTDTEPTYTAGASSSLYFVDLAVFTDGSWLYSDVSLSTAYEAAKEAYAKAQNAQNSVDNLEIGGRNLLLNSSFSVDSDKWECLNADLTTVDGVTCGHIVGVFEGTAYTRQDVTDVIDWHNLDQTYVFSADMRLDNYVKGTTSPYLGLHFSGQYDNNGTTAYVGATTVSGSPYIASYADTGWVRISWVVKFDRALDILNAHIYTRDFTGDLYFKNLKLEKGNKATDWTPAPEDTDAIAEELRQAISEEHTSIISDASAITMEALKSYATIEQFNTFTEQSNSQMQLMSNQFSIQLTETTKQINSSNEMLQSQINSVTSYMNYTADDGLVLGKTGDPAKLQLQNDEFSILMHGNVVQSFDAEGHAITPELQVTRSLKLLGYMFELDQNGNVNCEYVGI